tara:strand:- start:718 stop:930 length:213 start_codon:yes stop_codon:yes gene_type:complete
MNDERTEYLFYCYLTNMWSRYIITQQPMDRVWVWKKDDQWGIGTENHSEVLGRFDKIFKEYESRYIVLRS